MPRKNLSEFVSVDASPSADPLPRRYGCGSGRNCEACDCCRVPRGLGLSDGDRVVLYTDGVIEAHDERYEMLDLEGFQRVLRDKALRPAGEPLAEELVREVQRFPNGPAEDDILIVELSRVSTPVAAEPSG